MGSTNLAPAVGRLGGAANRRTAPTCDSAELRASAEPPLAAPSLAARASIAS